MEDNEVKERLTLRYEVFIVVTKKAEGLLYLPHPTTWTLSCLKNWTILSVLGNFSVLHSHSKLTPK